ncbi:MAG: aminomethyl-transferring glycine dehydrogenase subunit GcvPA [Polyangia bacterium]|nr:aminomethyl-transferring glycine dehydrogenase subunit GcvPA [Polyangia bacterium]
MRYIPHTDSDVRRMLETIGAPSVEALFRSIPATDRAKRPLGLPQALDEHRLLGMLRDLSGQSRSATDCGGPLAFLGAGAHRHSVPAVLDHLVGRAEFLTAYTPYQAEISQGTLEAVFEFQTTVCEMFGLEVANASMYDGASAAAEALLMARRLTKRQIFLVSEGVHPEYLETCRTFISGLDGATIEVVPLASDGRTDLAAARAAFTGAAAGGGKDAGAACLLAQSPNFMGVVEDLSPLAALAHDHGALAVAAVPEVVSLGLLRPPGACGFDIAVGEGLGFAVPLSFGGPGVGLFATRDEHRRQIPGRLVGETVDKAGVRGFVLTLATREQHIRREKATSNICSNQALVALCFTIQSALLGKTGFARLARLNYSKAQYARRHLSALPGFSFAFSGPTFNEMALRVPGGDASALVSRMAEPPVNIVPGVALGRFRPEWRDLLLVNFTELHSREDIDRLVAALAAHGKEA